MVREKKARERKAAMPKKTTDPTTAPKKTDGEKKMDDATTVSKKTEDSGAIAKKIDELEAMASIKLVGPAGTSKEMIDSMAASVIIGPAVAPTKTIEPTTAPIKTNVRTIERSTAPKKKNQETAPRKKAEAAASKKKAEMKDSPKIILKRSDGPKLVNGKQSEPTKPNPVEVSAEKFPLMKGQDKAAAPKETREPINEEALPRLAVEQIFPRRKKAARFPMAVYFCQLCNCHMNSLKYADLHIQMTGHQRAKENYHLQDLLESIPWPPTDAHLAAVNVLLDHTAEAYGRSSEEVAQCFQLAEWLTRYFQDRLHLACQVRLYGSSRTGFALKTSNVNLELLFPPVFSHAKALIAALQLLSNDTQMFTDVKADFEAKWPNITFRASSIGFMPNARVDCVLSVCNLQAFEVSSLLEIYAKRFPRLVQLGQICRSWAKVCHLDDPQLCCLPAYAFDLMLVHYLQQREPPALPIFHEMDELGGKSVDVNRITQFGDKHFADFVSRCKKLLIEDEWNLAELWLGFLKFYTLDFDSQTAVVNIRSSKPVTREQKDWNNRKRIGIEDPFLPNKNVAQMTQHAFDYMTHCLSMTYKYFGVPQTIAGPLFDFDQGYKLVLRQALPSLKQGQPNFTGVDVQANGIPQTAAEIQKTLSELVASMAMKEKEKETVPNTSVKTPNYRYDRQALLDLYGEDYQCGPSWDFLFDDEQRSVLTGLEHIKRVSSGEFKVSCSFDGNYDEVTQDDSPPVSLTYVPSSSGRATPALTDVGLVVCDSGSVAFDDRQAQGNVISCILDRRSKMLSESSEFSSNDEYDFPSLRDFKMASTSNCIVEREESFADLNEGLWEREEDDECVQRSCDGAATTEGNPASDPIEPELSPIPVGQEGVDNLETAKTPDEPPSERSESPEDDVAMSGLVTHKRRKIVVNLEFVEAAKELTFGDYVFIFSEAYFTAGKTPAILCTFCNIIGHHSSICPEKKLPALAKLPPLQAAYKSTLDRFLYDLSQAYMLTTGRIQWQEQFRANLEQRLKAQLRPDSLLFLFGSSCNGFGFLRSDLDLCLTFGNSTVLDPLEDPLKLIRIIANILNKDKEFREVLPVTKAKVPIVRFFHSPSRLEGDISLYNCLALRNTKLLHTYSMIDERVKVLGYLVKIFAKSCDIGDASRGSLSSYAYIIMMLHYLQRTQPPVIPVLQEIYDTHHVPRPSVIVDGWETYFYSDLRTISHMWKGHRKNQQSVHDLWLGFLKYYVDKFDTKTFVIQMRRHEPLTKFEKLWSDKPMAIEDPFDLNHNLASGLSWRMYIYIMKTFIQATEAFGHPRHEKSLLTHYGAMLSYEGLEDYFFNYAVRPKEPPPRDRLCKLCGHVGHFAGTCPHRKSNKSNVAGNDKKNGGRSAKPTVAKPAVAK